MLEILTVTHEERLILKKGDENGVFAKGYIEHNTYAVKILFDLRYQNSTVTPSISSTS